MPRSAFSYFAQTAVILWTATGFLRASELPLETGDHVVVIGNTFADQLRWHGYFETRLHIAHPDKRLTFRVMGWSADTLSLQPRPLNFGSLDEQLAAQRADVVIACFGMNESFAGDTHLAAFQQQWRTFFEHMQSSAFNGQQPPRLAVVSPIFHEPQGDGYGAAATHNRSLRQYTEAMRELCEAAQVPFVDLYAFTSDLAHESLSQRLTTNGIHLNEYGYWAASQAIVDGLLPAPAARAPDESPYLSWGAVIDSAAGQVLLAKSVQVSNVRRNANELRFTWQDQSLPPPQAPAGSVAHRSLSRRDPAITVRNLPPGTYEILVDGESIAKATHTALALGVTPLRAPSLLETEAVRRAVNQKNKLFFLQWRAHNAEYIFGRRTKPFGAVSFPPEVAKQKQLLDAADRAIWSLLRGVGKQQQWIVRPAGE